jgi:hypothetical protein
VKLSTPNLIVSVAFAIYNIWLVRSIYLIYIRSLQGGWDSTRPCRVCQGTMRVVTVSRVGIFRSFLGATNYRCDGCDVNEIFGRNPVDLTRRQRFGIWKFVTGKSHPFRNYAGAEEWLQQKVAENPTDGEVAS